MQATSNREEIASTYPPESTAPFLTETVDSERRDKIVRIVKSAGDGVSTVDIAGALGVSPPTALRYLRDLEREREVYSRSYTKRRILLWYPNGRIIHPYLEIFREIRGKTYRASIQEGRSGPAAQVQERSFSLLHGERVEGAIFVDYAALDELIDLLRTLKQRFESVESAEAKP